MDAAVDLVTLTSSSTAAHLVELIAAASDPATLARVRQAVQFAAIGPITARTAAELGLRVAVQSREHTIAGLVEAICQWAKGEPQRA
jgi:uroporphyrinogen-III synthase